MQDKIFDALADPNRRALLLALTTETETTGIDPLKSESTDQQIRQAQYHVHLPKLDDYGYINWDRSAGTVERGQQFEEVRPVVERLADLIDDPGTADAAP